MFKSKTEYVQEIAFDIFNYLKANANDTEQAILMAIGYAISVNEYEHTTPDHMYTTEEEAEQYINVSIETMVKAKIITGDDRTHVKSLFVLARNYYDIISTTI